MALTKHEQAEAKVQKLWLQAKNSCKKFVQRWVKIEDRDAVEKGEELAIPFTLWPKQGEALDAFLDERLTIVLKARQLGLSWLTLAYAVWRIVFIAGYSVVAISKREDDAKELVRRVEFILKNLPKWMIQEKKEADPSFFGPVWEKSSLLVTIHHSNGVISTFKGETSGQNSGRSFTSNLVILDEWAFHPFAGQIWAAAYPTINRPTGGQVIGLSTNERGSLFEKNCQEALRGANNFKLIFLDVWTDPRRTHAWYEQTKIDLPDSWMQEYPETVQQAFSAGEGTAYPEFSIDVHVIPTAPVPSWHRKWMGHDPGHDNPFCWHWLSVDNEGVVTFYREYTRAPGSPKVFYDDQAAKVAEMSRYYDVELDKEVYEDIIYIVTGKDAFNKSSETGKTYIDYYRQGGLTFTGFIPAITDRKMRKATWHHYLKPIPDPENPERKVAKVRIMDNCKELIRCLPQLIKDKKDNEKVEDNPEIDNPFDCGGYALISYHVKQSKQPEEEKGTIGQLKDKLAKQNKRFEKRLG